MTDDDLRSQLVDLIDTAAEPVTFDEVRACGRPRTRRVAARGRRTRVIAVAAVILLAVRYAPSRSRT